MNLITSSTALRGRHPARAVLLCAFTLLAMLFCLLAVQSTGAEHAMAAPGIAGQTAGDGMTAGHLAGDSAASMARPAASVAAGPPVFTPAPLTAGPTMRLAGSANQPTLCYDNNSLAGGGHTASGCSIPLVVAPNALLAQLPSVSHLALASGEFQVDSYRAIPPHLHRPSLTLLSISRV